MGEETEAPAYRVKKISLRRGWAIDQISFQYTDGTVWSVGIDGGRKDNREIILCEGEYLVRVSHEKLIQRWYAGASLELETNRGRVFSFHPHLATKRPEDVTTIHASPGTEIIRLNIRNGALESVTEQPAPVDNQPQPGSNHSWYTVVTPTEAHSSQSQAEARRQFIQTSPALLMDTIRNRIIEESGSPEQIRKCRQLAVEQGFFIPASRDNAGFSELAKLWFNRFNFYKDGWIILFSLTCAMIANCLSGYSSLVTGLVLSTMGAPDLHSVRNVTLVQDICSLIQHCNNLTSTKLSLVAALLLMKLVGGVVQNFNAQIRSIMYTSESCRLRASLLHHTLHLDMGFFDTSTEGDILSSMNPAGYLEVTSQVMLSFTESVLAFLWKLYFMISINYNLAISLMMVFFTLKILVLGHLLRKVKIIHKVREKINTMLGQTQYEAINMIHSVKMMSKENQHLGEQKSALYSLRTLAISQAVYDGLSQLLLNSLQDMAFALGLVSCIFYLDDISPGDLTAFFLIFQECSGIYGTILQNYKHGISQLPAAEKMLDLLEQETRLKSGPLQPSQFDGRIEFQGVEFSYPSRPGHLVLKGLSFIAEPGQVTAVVGDSGAGKTTLTNLILRLYDPDGGAIFIDGYKLKELDLQHYHQNVAVVNQNPLLFSGSIRDNIAYGSTREVTMEEVEKAAKFANAHDFITSFRGGYETQCGTKGTKLSGGQCQRIAIARAAIRNPRILILDEATSSLDAENEKIVSEAMEKLMKGRTIFIIAHRLSTIKRAQKILVLQRGQIVEEGTHRSLLMADGAYKRLIRKQLSSATD